MNSSILALVCCLAASEVSSSETPPPYTVTVCLRVQPHPLLTSLFVDSLRRQVRDHLHGYLGKLASIDVKTEGHWWISDYQDEPAAVPTLTPELLRAKRAPGKLFLIGVAYHQSGYRISCQHVDAELLYIGGISEHATTDRQWVSRAICLAIKQDFGVLADVTGTGNRLSLKFRLPAVQEPAKPQLMRLLGGSSVFQPYLILPPRGDQKAKPPQAIPFTLLHWRRDRPEQPALLANSSQPWPAGAHVVAIRLPTRAGRLQLQVLDRETETGAVAYTVEASDKGFDSWQDSDIVGRPDRLGNLFPNRYFDQIAYLRLRQGDGASVKVAIPMVAEVNRQVLRVSVDPQAAAKNDVGRKLRFLMQDLSMAGALREDATNAVNDLNRNKHYEEALQRADGVVTAMRPMLEQANSNLRELRDTQSQLQLAENPLVKTATGQIQALEKQLNEFSRIQQSLQEAIDTRDAQKRADVLVELGQTAETDGDIDEALLRYGLALKEQPDQPQLQAKLDQLEADWRTKGPAHEEAREFLRNRWAEADVSQIDSLFSACERAFTTLSEHGDYLFARRLAKLNAGYIVDLQSIVEQAINRGEAADLEEAKKYQALLDRLATFQNRVVELGATRPAAPNSPPASPPVEADSPATGETRAGAKATAEEEAPLAPDPNR